VQINISARHGHLSDKTRAKISAKIDKLSRLFERLTQIEVTIDLEHEENPTVDVRVSAEHKHDFVATEQSGDLMGSLDNVIHKLEQQLRKYKEKVQDRHRTPGNRQIEGAPELGGE
jgi:putative sigma-54 modulation protein